MKKTYYWSTRSFRKSLIIEIYQLIVKQSFLLLFNLNFYQFQLPSFYSQLIFFLELFCKYQSNIFHKQEQELNYKDVQKQTIDIILIHLSQIVTISLIIFRKLQHQQINTETSYFNLEDQPFSCLLFRIINHSTNKWPHSQGFLQDHQVNRKMIGLKMVPLSFQMYI
ncbi:unnamed protein product [Paramecium sonneborni]|uniref:Transmembrane protein n=1 Tax=Paramecium sonneborni TaxID=65129 RepID=A0A8S1K0W2_9CILI|nr:unnamed protein product [Paramecium sonneborni]